MGPQFEKGFRRHPGARSPNPNARPGSAPIDLDGPVMDPGIYRSFDWRPDWLRELYPEGIDASPEYWREFYFPPGLPSEKSATIGEQHEWIDGLLERITAEGPLFPMFEPRR